MLDKFGFGQHGTAQNFPEAHPGERPKKNPQFIPQVTSGFGFKSSALEILQAYGAIANGGTLMEPVLPKTEATSIRRVLSTENSEKIRKVPSKRRPSRDRHEGCQPPLHDSW